jgi:hypothetical protein
MSELETKEELILIANRKAPGDNWVLLIDPNYVYPSLTEALEGYFQETGQTYDFRLSPIKGELYLIGHKVVEKTPPPPPPPPKKFNMYGDY